MQQFHFLVSFFFSFCGCFFLRGEEMTDFEEIVSKLDLTEAVEDALYHLESTFEEEGVVHLLEADKCLTVLRGLCRGEVVQTLENLLGDAELLDDTLLKIHYVYQLTKNVQDRKINLTSLMVALKHIPKRSIKFLTPQDISFIAYSLPPSKIATGAQAVAKQIDHIKKVKDDLISKTTELQDHDTDVNSQLEICEENKEQYMEHILEDIKAKFLFSEYSTSKSGSSSTPTNTTSEPSPSPRGTSTRLDAQLNKNKTNLNNEEKDSIVPTTKVNKKTLHALLNKSAEHCISRLEYDEAFDSLVSEVGKLEKKFVAQKPNKGETTLRKRMNELLLRQVELAETKRVLHEKTMKSILDHTHSVHEKVEEQRLQKALREATLTETKINKDFKTSQEQFNDNLIETEEYFNKLLLDINAKRILDMQKTNAANSKRMEMETRMLVSDKTEFEGKQKMYEKISDELFEQLKLESKQMMEKFKKVYDTTAEIIEENRNVDVSDKRQLRKLKTPLQSKLTDLYSDIHSMQHNFAENPILDFQIELSRVCDAHESNSLKFLGKSEKMYEECQETYINSVLSRYETSKEYE